MTPTIRVTRGSYFSDMARAYKIFIDGVHCGNIKDSEVVEFPVDYGRHEICAKIDWCRSNRLFVEVNSSTVDIEVGPSAVGWRFLFTLVYITFLRHKYLWLEERR